MDRIVRAISPMRDFQMNLVARTFLFCFLIIIAGCSGGGGGGEVGTAAGDGAGFGAGGRPPEDSVPAIREVIVSPANFSLPKGLSQRFTAEVVMTDGTRLSLTSGVSWRVIEPAVATVTSDGLVEGVQSGTTEVEATVNGVSGRVQLTVTDAVLQSLRLNPAAAHSLPKGAQWNLQAIGSFSDGSELDVTGQANWSSSQPGVALVAAGMVETVGEGTTQIRAALQGRETTVSLTVTAAELLGIEIQASSSGLPLGLNQELRVFGRYTDNSLLELSSVDWSSSDIKVAIVNSLGQVTSASSGQATILASYQGKTGTFELTVSSVVLEELYFAEDELEVYAGLLEGLTVYGRFSDGTVREMGDQVSWSSLDASIASISRDGRVTGQKAGSVRVRALSGNGVAEEVWVYVSDATLDQIVLTVPQGPLPVGVRVKLEALGVFSDGTTRDVTDSVSWIPSDGNLGLFETSRGWLNTVGAGELTVRATGGPVSRKIEATATITIVSLDLDELLPSPAVLEIPVKETQQFQAFGLFSDGKSYDVSHKISWSYAGSGASSISNSGSSKGRFSAGLSAGSGVLTATHSDGMAATVAVTVVSGATVSSIEMSPRSLELPKGNTYQRVLTATVTYSNGFQAQATRGTYSGTSGIVDAFGSGGIGGVVTRGVGDGTVTLYYDALTDSIPVTVTDAALESLSLSPRSLTLPAGLTSKVFCTGSFSDDSRRDISDTLVWSSSNTRVATVEPGGRLTTHENGVATITALDQTTGIKASLDVTVVRKILSSLKFDEGPSVVRVGGDRAFKIEGLYHDGSLYDLTDSVDWNSSNPGIAQVSSTGQLTAGSIGQATITAREPISGEETSLQIELVNSVKLSETVFSSTVQELQNSPEGTRLYVLTETDLNIYQADDMQLIQSIAVAGGVGMDVSSDGTTVLIAHYDQFALTEINTVTFASSTIALPDEWRTRDVAFGNNGYAYLLLDRRRPASLDLSTMEVKLGTGGTNLSYARYMHYDPITSKLITGDYGVSPSRVNRYSIDGPDVVWEASLNGGSNGRALTIHPQGGSFVFATATGNALPGYSSYSILHQPILNLDQPISEMPLGAYPLDSAFSPSGSVLYAINSSSYDQQVHLYCPETGRFLGYVLPETDFDFFSFGKVEVSGDGSRLYLYIEEEFGAVPGLGSVVLIRLRP